MERTELENATLLTVGGRLCVRRDNSFNLGVHVLGNYGAIDDFMSMQTAKRAQVSLYNLRHQGHVMTARSIQSEVLYYTRAYFRIGEFVFRHHFNFLEVLPD